MLKNTVMHTTTQKQLTLGAGGFIIIRDDEEAALALPRTYGVDDIPLVLTSRRFTTTNGVANQFQYTATAYGDYALANGTLNAAVAIGFLAGDANRSGTLNAGDIVGLKRRVGENTTRANFLYDLDASGKIDLGDLSTLKTSSG